MSMPTTDYNQQLLCYLQNWRQLLEQWAAMAAGSPFLTAPPVLPTAPAGGQFMPPTAPFMPFMPFMPPMPPTAPVSPAPPAPADYTQQLFSYLQAWRQYLEQQTSAIPASPQAWTAQQPTAVPANDGGKSGPRPPDVPIPPDDPTGSKGVLQSDDHEGSGPIPPKVVPRAPSNVHQSQLSDISLDPAAIPFDRPFDGPFDGPFEGPFEGPGERFQMADPVTLSARPGASRPISEASARPEVNSAFRSAMNRVGPIASPQIAPRSLFSNPGASTRFREAGETPTP
jgi:hypothetical protein